MVLQIDGTHLAGQAEKVLAGVPSVLGAARDDAVVRARVADGSRDLPAVLGVLDAAGLAVRSVTVARPSLDDVYLRHAGRTFHQAERAALS